MMMIGGDGQWCSSVVEHWSLTGELSWPAPDLQLMGNHLYG